MNNKDNSIISESPEATMKLGKQISKEYNHSLILLHGELGAGKTLFVKGFAEGIGIDTKRVSSPSYTLMNEYKLNKDFSIFHIDLYRLNSFEEVIDIGLFDILESNMPCLVEWAERIEELNKLPHLDITIKRVKKQTNDNADSREISWQWKEATK